MLLGLGLVLAVPAAMADGRLPPPQSDSWVSGSQFLACKGNAYALCYYSGPEKATPRVDGEAVPRMPCTLDPDSPDAADCSCYAVSGASAGTSPLGVFFQYNYVLMTGILNDQVREDTRQECGPLGDDCLNLHNLEICASKGYEGGLCQEATVCSMLGNPLEKVRQTLYPDRPDVDLISTFSFDHISEHSFGSTSCDSGLYAGCMTAPCTGLEGGLTTCECPTYTGKFQIGQQPDRLSDLGLGCDISPRVWSAANHIKPPSD